MIRLLSRAHGFAMIEILVSIVIVSVGLLGLVGLQASAMKTTHSSSFRSVASARASDIADRIRANYSGFLSNAYFDIWGTPSSLPANQHCYPVVLGGSQTASACDRSKIALDDAFMWQAGNADALPGGFGVVCRDSSPYDGTPSAPACSGGPADARVVVKIWWNDSRAGGASATDQLFVTVFQP